MGNQELSDFGRHRHGLNRISLHALTRRVPRRAIRPTKRSLESAVPVMKFLFHSEIVNSVVDGVGAAAGWADDLGRGVRQGAVTAGRAAEEGALRRFLAIS